MKLHPRTQERLRRKALTDAFNAHLTNYKKIIPVNESSDSIGGFSMSALGTFTPQTRGGKSDSTEIIFSNGRSTASKREVDMLKKRLLINSDDVGDLLTHPNDIIRKLSQVGIIALERI